MWKINSNRFLKAFVVISQIIFLIEEFFVCLTASEVGLPLIQISHDDDLDNDYPELREEVHLEDFFWTGSGDGPPDYLKKVHTGISKGKDVVVKTETVVATVYVDGNNEVDIPICLDCFGEGTVGIDGTWSSPGMPPLNYSATDRRYWLLTVISGFYTQKDNRMLEEKLARLYRLAFTRQQTKHLGLNGESGGDISGISLTAGRDRRHKSDPDETSTISDLTDYDTELIDMFSNNTANQKLPSSFPINTRSELISSSEEIINGDSPTNVDTNSDMIGDSSNNLAYVTPSWEFIQDGADKSEKQIAATVPSTTQQQQTIVAATVKSTMPPQQLQQLKLPETYNLPLVIRDDQVRVVIHNITQLTEEDIQKGSAVIAGTVAETAAGQGASRLMYDGDINDKIDERPIANQTELIYSVFVNGLPVLALTASNDMKLVSEAEVATMLGKETFLKSEPYLREPLATPLAPSTHSGTVGFIDSVQNNPVLVIISSVAILLLLLLLIALLLMGRSHIKHKNQDTTRTTSRNELLSEIHSVRPTSSGTGLDTGRTGTTTQSRDVGIQNFSYESETAAHNSREPRIHFPGPPPTRSPRRASLTSSDNTSDSSVYCPINPPPADVQRMLDEKASTLFDRHKTRRQHHNQYDRAEGQDTEAVYTTVISEKKRDKSRHKPKRKYLSENRVGSLETSPVQSHKEYSEDEREEKNARSNMSYERTEAFNRHNNYHRNKLMHQKTIFNDRDYDQQEHQSTEAVNKEILKALQISEKSSDTGSIGSYLSMQSVKAFPKTTLPEPLNRVLEPVFVTYYDNIENAHQSSGKPIKKSSSSRNILDASTIATIESFPSPKAPLKVQRFASHSDNPDPGVVGPIVWERHKKRLSADDILDKGGDEDDDIVYQHSYSPARDPAAMRNHYEGLLEGAIQMYSSQDDLPMPLPTKDFTNQRRPTKRELRGSSAGASNVNLKSYNYDNRPSTAQPEKTSKSNQSTQPPSPASGAWSSRSAHGSLSHLARPMSAGPVHYPVEDIRPTSRNLSKSRHHLHDNSAAPLIEAIQNELRKFQNDPK